MNRYEKYKPTNIEWIGEIPEHWEVKKLKYIGESLIGITYSPDDISDEENGILVLRSSNIQDGKLAFEDCVYVNKEIKEKHLTKEGDVLLCARNGSAHLVGKSALIRKENANITWGAFMSIFRSSIGEFAYQFFNSQIFKSQTGLFSTSTINQLTTDTLNNLFVPVPLPEEQTTIANYLDEKTAQIDKLIANKQQLIELLKEERTAIINKAVSGKGKKWERKKLKYVAKIKYGLGQPPKQKSDGLPLIRATNVERGKINETDLIFVDPDDVPFERDPVLKENDIIVVRSGAYTADSAIIPKKYDGAITGYDLVVRVINDNPFFIAYGLLSADILIGQLYLQKLRAAQPHLNREELGETVFNIPSLEIQNEIVSLIQTETQRIDNTISKIETEIELVQEYKTALISEVVTGKQKVIN